jgi:hypothetical protein
MRLVLLTAFAFSISDSETARPNTSDSQRHFVSVCKPTTTPAGVFTFSQPVLLLTVPAAKVGIHVSEVRGTLRP